MKIIRKTIEYCECLPRGYGIAWHDPARRVVVCYPVGLHIVARLVREAYWRLRMPWPAPGLRERLAFVERERDDLRATLVQARRAHATRQTTERVEVTP